MISLLPHLLKSITDGRLPGKEGLDAVTRLLLILHWQTPEAARAAWVGHCDCAFDVALFTLAVMERCGSVIQGHMELFQYAMGLLKGCTAGEV